MRQDTGAPPNQLSISQFQPTFFSPVWQPFHESTDPILFSWLELHAAAAALSSEAQHAPEMRLVGDDQRVVPNASLYYGLPFDVQEGASLENLLNNVRAASSQG